MANQGACTLSVLLLSIAAAAWVTAVPTAQAGTDALRRNLYGPESPEFFGFLDDHESARQKGTEAEQQPSRLATGNAMIGSSSDGRSTRGQMIEGYSREEDAIDRLLRNLDHIGGGNLLRRSLANSRRWAEFRRNLDQIGGGNLLRDVENRGERNLDHIGGGNLVRNLNSVLVEADHIRRNLDQIGDSTEERSQDGFDDGGSRRFRSSSRAGQPRREIDFASGPSVFLVDDAAEPSLISSQSGLLPSDRMLLERFGKRNIDEIDRTAFDNFFKRNLDEIDRVGWSGFAKRLAAYLTTGRTNALERHG